MNKRNANHLQPNPSAPTVKPPPPTRRHLSHHEVGEQYDMTMPEVEATARQLEVNGMFSPEHLAKLESILRASRGTRADGTILPRPKSGSEEVVERMMPRIGGLFAGKSAVSDPEVARAFGLNPNAVGIEGERLGVRRDGWGRRDVEQLVRVLAGRGHRFI
ncbi:MAG: hypothetical protein FWD17_02910 [Polyangiaceae bacterium]|nr:hypothetical protein [Polyangiaceae bacterium]